MVFQTSYRSSPVDDIAFNYGKLIAMREFLAGCTHKSNKPWMSGFRASLRVLDARIFTSSFDHPSYRVNTAMAAASNPVSACSMFQSPSVFLLMT